MNTYLKALLFVLSLCVVIVATPRTTEGAGIGVATKQPEQFVVHNTFAKTNNPGASRGFYVISFSLSAFGNDMYIPATAMRKIGTSPVGKGGIEYTIMTGDETLESGGNTFGALLSTSTVVEGFYKIPKDEARTFTLITLFDNTGNKDERYRMLIDRVRFHPKSITTGEQSDDIHTRQHRTKLLSLTK